METHPSFGLPTVRMLFAASISKAVVCSSWLEELETATNSLPVSRFIELVKLQRGHVPYVSWKRTMFQSNNYMRFEAVNQECIMSRYLPIGSSHRPQSYMESCQELML